MRRHVAAELWAAAERGELSPARVARMDRHAESCQQCALSRERVREGRQAMAQLAAEEPPQQLAWDHIGARIYWQTSSEQRGAGRSPVYRHRRLIGGLAGVAALAAASLVALLVWRGSGGQTQSAETAGGEPAPGAPSGERAEAALRPGEPIRALVTLAGGAVVVDGGALRFDDLLGAGAHISAGERSSAAFQFGPGSGFRVGADSSVTLVRLDSRRIELAVSGLVDVDITRRDPGQEFVVVAGRHQVVVRGTAFRVDHRDGELTVECVRGAVVVTDGGASVGVSAGERFAALTEAWTEAVSRSVPMSEEERRAVERALRVPLVPVWDGPEAVLAGTGIIEVAGEPGRSVAVDGVRTWQGKFHLRALSGPHEIAVIDDDSLADDETVTVVAGQVERAALERQVQSGRQGRQRRAQLDEAVRQRGGARRCLDRLEKQGLVEGSFVVFDVGINDDGSQGHLNVVDSNLGPSIQRCLRREVDAVQLEPGPSARFRYRLQF